jgi:ethanolamine utilization protein EutQ
MARTVISSAEVSQAASSRRLSVPADAIVTPLARDLAADLGVEITRAPAEPAPMGSSSPSAAVTDDLAVRVRAILAPLLGSGGGGAAVPPAPAARRPPVKLTRIGDARLQKFPYAGPPADMQVDTVDVVSADDGAPFAAGYMSITRGRFPWTMTYDELQIVLEGELHLGGDAGEMVGRPGDVLFVPKGSSVVFETPTWAKFVYVTFPANWQDQIR